MNPLTPEKTMTKRKYFAGFAVLLLVAVPCAYYFLSDDKMERAKPRITVGKATTFVDGPLDAEGHVDYAAALNERLGKGVTPENNAAVLLCQAIGPKPKYDEVMPAEIYKILGIDPLPEKGDYFVDFVIYVRDTIKPPKEKNLGAFQEIETNAYKKPWTAAEHPELAAWLKAMEKPLAMVVEATKRPHYFLPVSTDPTKNFTSRAINSTMLLGTKLGEIATALCVRAMLHLGKGESARSWADLQVCHTLARFAARSGTIIAHLKANAIDQLARGGDLAFLKHADLDAKQLESCQRDLQAMPPLGSLADAMDLTERMMCLDMILQYAYDPDAELVKRSNAKLRKTIDWDSALEIANQHYDGIADYLRETDPAIRAAKKQKYDSEYGDVKTSEADVARLLRAWSPDGKAVGKAVGEVILGMMLSSVRSLDGKRDRQILDNLILAFALARYRLDNGSYPQELAALAPKYIKEVPRDRFSGGPLIYKLLNSGYLFYSIGPNGQDDGGHGPYADPGEGDDIGVRMTIPGRIK